ARPDVTAGNEMPATTAMIIMTMRSSSSVMPALAPLLPADNVFIETRPARLPIGAPGHHIGFIAMVSGIFVNVSVSPGIGRHIFLEVRAVPLLNAARLNAQCLQSLFSAGVASGVEMVLAKGELEILELLPGRDHASL